MAALIPGHLFDWKIEWGFAALTTIGGVALYPRFHRLFPKVSRYGLLTVSILTVISGVSYLVTTAQARFGTGVRDLVDLGRPLMIYFSCTLGFSYGVIPLERLRRLCTIVLVVSLFCVAVLLLRPPLLIDFVDAVYGSTKTGITDFMVRVSIPFENPNFLGVFAVLSLVSALFFAENPDYVLAALAMVVIGLTGSRTAWLVTLVVALVYLAELALHVLQGRRFRWVLPLFVVAAAGVFLARRFPPIMETNQRLTGFVEALGTVALLQDESYQERVAMRANAFALIEERPILGWGAIKDSQVDIVDNQYVSLFIRVGLLGVLVGAWAFGGLFGQHLREAGAGKRHQVFLLWTAILAWMWSGSFAENIRLSILIAMICASTVAGNAKRIT